MALALFALLRIPLFAFSAVTFFVMFAALLGRVGQCLAQVADANLLTISYGVTRLLSYQDFSPIFIFKFDEE